MPLSILAQARPQSTPHAPTADCISFDHSAHIWSFALARSQQAFLKSEDIAVHLKILTIPATAAYHPGAAFARHEITCMHALAAPGTDQAPLCGMMPQRPSRVLIIGAGPGGLAAALLLAKAGLDVQIIERLPRAGGRCSAIEQEGFRFDLGPTFFLYPRVLKRIFRLAGFDLEREIPMRRLDPQYRIMFGAGGQLDCTSNIVQMEKQIAAIHPGDAANFQQFLTDNRCKMNGFRSILERPFQSWRDLICWDLIKMLPVLRPWHSVDSELRRYFSDPRVRLAFTFQAKYLGMSPFQCPSLFSILSFLEYEYGVWHPLGGCAAVSEAMARIAQLLRVRIHYNEEVKEVRFQGKRAVGVRTESHEYQADAIIVNADFAQAIAKLTPDSLRRKWSNKKIESKKYSCSTYMMYLGINGCYDHIPHHTIYTAANYKDNLADIESHHCLTSDTSLYIQNASITDSSLAPSGKSTLYILAPVSHQHDNIDWRTQKIAFRNVVIKQLQRLGLHDLEQRIQFEKIITPADWESRYAVYRGATFNLTHNLGQMLHLRPHNRFEELDGVYIVGGGTHPGSGLPVIYESARITSRLLLDDFGRDTSWLGAPGQDERATALTQ